MKRLSVVLITCTMLSTPAWAQMSYPGQPTWGGGNHPDYHAGDYADHAGSHHESMHHESAHHEEHHAKKHHHHHHHDDKGMEKH